MCRCGRCAPSTRTGRARHAAERPRRRPQPQLPLELARRRRAVRRLPPRPARGLGARDARADAHRPPHPARHHDPLPPGLRAGEPHRWAPTTQIVRDYARRSGLPAKRLPRLPRHRDGLAERPLPRDERVRGRAARRRPDRGAARRHARAVLAQAPTRSCGPSAAAPKPPIVWSPIPFGADRVRQMRAYARRHYGLGCARLLAPKAIVEHFTATSSYGPAWNTFAANAPDIEFGERPGVCAHFIVDRDGTIHQLVPLKWMCRHTVGLNHVALGIEHVGTSDGDVLGRAPPARRLAGAHALAAGPLRDPRGRRDRARGEPLQPVPPRARGGACAAARTATSRPPRCGAIADAVIVLVRHGPTEWRAIRRWPGAVAGRASARFRIAMRCAVGSAIGMAPCHGVSMRGAETPRRARPCRLP